jgi:hypothetical protein
MQLHRAAVCDARRYLKLTFFLSTVCLYQTNNFYICVRLKYGKTTSRHHSLELAQRTSFEWQNGAITKSSPCTFHHAIIVVTDHNILWSTQSRKRCSLLGLEQHIQITLHLHT